MSPVDPRSIPPSARTGGTVGPGVACGKCDYPLEGLLESGKCPECGTSIRRPRTPGVQARDNLTDAPVPYLQRLRWGVIALALLGVGNSVLQVVGMYWHHPAAGWTMAAVGAAWAAAVWVPTMPRAFQSTMRTNPARELRRTRMTARLSQLAWPMQGLCLAVMLDVRAAQPQLAETLRVCAGLFQLVGVLGFVPLCVWLAHLADWAQETALAGRLRVTAVLIGLGGAALTVSLVLVALLAGTKFAAPLSILAGLALLAYQGGLIVFIVSQVQLANMANWAVRNAKATLTRDQRVLERKARRTFTGNAAAGTLLAEMANKRGEAVLDPCAGCGYDLTGLPPGARCPECGRMPDEDSTAFLRHPQRDNKPAKALDDIPLVGDEPGEATQNGQAGGA